MCIQDKSEQAHNMKEMARTNAVKYQRYKDQFDQIDLKEIVQYRREVEDAFTRIQRYDYPGKPFILFVDYEPYENLEQLTADVLGNNIMKISSLNNSSLLLPGLFNLKFRAVHDYLHYFLQQPFGFAGEYKVYQAQKHMHKSRIGRQILFSEVVLQAAYCEYFGTFAPTQKIVL